MNLRTPLIFCLVFVLLLCSVQAISIGISPGRVNFDSVLRDGYAERTVTISTNAEEVLTGHFEVTGDIEDWVFFDPNATTFEITQGNPLLLTVIVQPPTDLPQGNYSGSIEFITDGIGGVGGRAGGVVKTAVVLIVQSEVSGEEIIACTGGGFNIKNTEVGFPLELEVDVVNEGNVRLTPEISLTVFDQLQSQVVLTDSVTGDLVLPTRKENIQRRLNNPLEEGQYWAEVEIEQCGIEDLLTFSVVEQGGIVDSGTLRNIYNPLSITLGETVEIVANFVNTGPRSVNARFNGIIRKDDSIVKPVETEEFIVPSGEEIDFKVLFTPFESGRYTLNGRVTYNKKITFEKGTVINVLPPNQERTQITVDWILLLLYLIIIMTILFLLRKIIKERRKRHY